MIARAHAAGIPAVRARQARELTADAQLIRHGLLTVLIATTAAPGGSTPGAGCRCRACLPGSRARLPGAASTPS